MRGVRLIAILRHFLTAPGEGAAGTSSHIAAWVVIATETIQPGKAAGSPGFSRLGLAARERVLVLCRRLRSWDDPLFPTNAGTDCGECADLLIYYASVRLPSSQLRRRGIGRRNSDGGTQPHTAEAVVDSARNHPRSGGKAFCFIVI